MKRLLLIFFLLVPLEVHAAWHLYLVPIIGAGTKADCRRPKYARPVCTNPPIAHYVMVDFGFQAAELVAANVSGAQDTSISGQADVTKIPDNLDATVGAALATVQAKLEAVFIPAGWVTSGMTYRTVVRVVLGGFEFFQRYSGISGNTLAVVDGSKVTLSTTFNDLPLQARQDLLATAESLGLDGSSLTGASTIREIFLAIGQQAAARVWVIGGITI